jgi:hypothetical protein
MQKIKLNKRMLTVGSLGEGRPTSAQACEALRGRPSHKITQQGK